ncbi:alkene reductase [Patulibacter minatonensis]|uniref:alkene reductase n=1 Tax=Patulibacter minatonensis TaxID=298163 RepID=UPI0006874E11|nr:alkene reductase [Patulibacter minatonensis]
MPDLFDPIRLGPATLANRIAMAPMTRGRRPDERADAMTARYYGQRATAGLIVTEGTTVSEQARGGVSVPGIWTPEQTAGWRLVTERVHAEGGHVFAQLWHVGRLSHAALQPGGGSPVSSSATPLADDPDNRVFATLEDGVPGFVRATPPRALELAEIADVVGDFAAAARNAIDAGFDGVEIHGANGYLVEQFLNPNINRREDRYGGSIENRSRLAIELVDAVAAAVGADRVGIRLSPFGRGFDNAAYAETVDTYLLLARELQERGVVYVHLNDQRPDGERIDEGFLRAFRSIYSGVLLLAGGLDKTEATDLIARDLIDVAAFGRHFIANPDLVRRLAADHPLAEPDVATFYGGGDAGYVDYPPAERDADAARP